LSDVVKKLKKNDQNNYLEILFKYWKILGNKINIFDVFCDSTVNPTTINFTDNNDAMNLLFNNIQENINNGNISSQVYKIEYDQNTEIKTSYIFSQIIKYQDLTTRTILYFLDTESETDGKLMIINFHLLSLADLFIMKYKIFGNTFYRDDTVTVKFNSIKIYTKQTNDDNLRSLSQTFYDLLKQECQKYTNDSIILSGHVPNIYDNFCKELVDSHGNNKQLILKNYYSKVSTLNDTLYFLLNDYKTNINVDKKNFAYFPYLETNDTEYSNNAKYIYSLLP